MFADINQCNNNKLILLILFADGVLFSFFSGEGDRLFPADLSWCILTPKYQR